MLASISEPGKVGSFRARIKSAKRKEGLLRKVFHAMALPLVRKGRLYGDYYHKKKDETKMPGNKAMTIVARHLLRKIFGWYRSGKAFDEQRFFTCKSRHQKLLAEAA